MANKKLLTILAGAAVSFPVIGTAQLGALSSMRNITLAAAGDQVVVHTVRPGENLWRIAKDHGLTEQELMDFNRLPNSTIRPGDVIRMPSRPLPHSGDKLVSKPSSTVSAPAAMNGSYTVRSGDVLTRIARAHGVSTEALMSSNGIKDATKLRIGQTLKVPGSAGSAAVASAPRAATTTASATTHTVRRGDTLFGIASQHKVAIAQIKSANNLSTERLSIGQTLVVPGSSLASGRQGEVVQASATPPVQPKVSDFGQYTVQRGDSFSKIAREFDTSVDSLLEINKITNPNVLVQGQTLIVPGGGRAAPAPAPAHHHGEHDHETHDGGAHTGTGASVAAAQNLPPAALPDPSPVRSGGVQDYAGYTIVPGDTLETIAQTFATTKDELMRLNKLSAPNEVKSGDQILVPTFGIYNDLGGPY